MANIFNITRTRTHECIISSNDDWIDFVSDSCYSLNCEDGKNWTDVDGRKQSFLDWMATAKVRYDSKYNHPNVGVSDSPLDIHLHFWSDTAQIISIIKEFFFKANATKKLDLVTP